MIPENAFDKLHGEAKQILKMPEPFVNIKYPFVWLSVHYGVSILFSITVQAGGRSSPQGECVMISVVASIDGERQFQAEILLAS